MTLQQGIELAQMAKAKGYCTRALAGKIQFVVLDSNFDVELEITDYLDYADAKEIIEQ